MIGCPLGMEDFPLAVVNFPSIKVWNPGPMICHPNRIIVTIVDNGSRMNRQSILRWICNQLAHVMEGRVHAVRLEVGFHITLVGVRGVSVEETRSHICYTDLIC